MRKLSILSMIFVLVLAFSMNVSYAKVGDQWGSMSLLKPSGTPDKTLININNVAHWIWATGISAHDPAGQSGIFFPRLTAAAIYTDGLLWGGFVNDGKSPAKRVGGVAYITGLLPGRIISKGVAENPDAPDVRIWRVRRDYATASLEQDAAELNSKQLSEVTPAMVDAVRAQYQKDWNEWPWQKGAPFYDVNGNGVLDLGYTEDLNGNGRIDFPGEIEEPGIAGADQVAWVVMNDLNETAVFNLYGSPPIGIECQLTLWGYKRTDALGNVVFKQYRLIYKGTADTPSDAAIDSCYFSVFSDPDLGDAGDDLIGCDTHLSMSFVYNAVSQDANYLKYNLPPPAAGYDFLQGPLVFTGNPDDEAIFKLKKRSGYINLPMTAFNFFGGGGITDPPQKNYDGTEQWYNMMNGLKPLPVANPAPYLDIFGNPTLFTFSGDPVTASGDRDGVTQSAGDRRFSMHTGPFKLAFGDTQEVVIATVLGLGGDRLSSVAVMKFNDISAQNAYNNLFQLPSAPPSPKLRVTNLSQKVLLNWGEDFDAVDATESQDVQGYKFEGYNVYQLPFAGASMKDAKKIATYDVVNEITTVLDPQFDEASGVILEKVVHVGKNSGINRILTLTTDLFTDKPLVNGTEYYYAVTAYNVNPAPDALPRSLESLILAVKAVPQGPKPGVRLTLEAGEALPVTKVGDSDGKVVATVVDPTKTTGNTYTLGFEQHEGDHGMETVWYLQNDKTGKRLLDGETDQAGSPSLPVDGMVVQVSGPPAGMKPLDMFDTDDKTLWGWDVPAGARWWTWGNGNWGSEGFRGAIGWGDVWFSGTSLSATDVHTVLLKFSKTDLEGNIANPADADVSMAFRYLRAATLAPQKPEFADFIINKTGGYAFQDRRPVPVAAFDQKTGKRLAIGFLENNQPNGAVNGRYWPPTNAFDNIGGNTPREWLFIFANEYTTGSDPVLEKDILNNTVPLMWFCTVTRRGNAAPNDPDELLIIANAPNSPAVTFKIATKAPSYDANLAKADLELIKAFPNPYYGFNPREVNQVNRFITFGHLPEKATFRIFDLAGNLVQTLEKNDPEQFFTWDLLNHNELPVASGIYLVHIEMPQLGATKILKLAVVREQEFLEVY